MYIPITGINGVSLTRPPQQPENHSSTPGSALSFNETLAAVNAATLDQAERMKRKYGVRVRIQTVSTGEKELEHPGTGGGGREIVIAPNILQQMAKDPAVRDKMYGIIDRYISEEQTSLMSLQPPSGGKTLSHSLIVHKDGTVAVWSAPPILSRNLLSAAGASLQGQEREANPADGIAAHLHQIQLMRARRKNKLL